MTANPAVTESLNRGQAKVAGLLGFDFIAAIVLKIDYAAGTAQAFDPVTFSAPPGATGLPISIDSGQPLATARIGASAGQRFLIDTGNPRTVLLYPSFWEAHPVDVGNVRSGPTMQQAGVGGSLDVKVAEVGDLLFGPIEFHHVAVEIAPQNNGLDGNIGAGPLRYFTVYFDYAYSTLFLTPNARK